MVAISIGVRGPGAMRRAANSAVTAAHAEAPAAAIQGRRTASPVNAAARPATASRCRPVRPGPSPISRRQWRPNLARSSALSALPACAVMLLRHPPRLRSGCTVTRRPDTIS
jgi:hypothetical protein